MCHGGRPHADAGSSLSALCLVMAEGEEAPPIWSAHDLGAILEHLLSVALEKELDAADRQHGRPGPVAVQAAQTAAQRGRAGAEWTFGDALSRSDVPFPLLVRVKEYAKHAMEDGGSLPQEAAKALYVAVVAHGRSCGHESLSSQSAASMERMVRWCLAQSWVPPAVRRAVRKGVSPR